MEKYRIFLRKSAADELDRIPQKDLARIIERIRSLEQNPRPHGCEKLSALERYRVRQGDYRIVYAVDDGEKSVDVVKIGHRSEVYRR
ncbi:MAG: addiction module antitoxin [Candidatus Aminicenantes bacterium RBG_19FT_COMBO_65_30]|nr:MAG: addiction module antitoxin [Candidatus Aminicenantes bacterium RBG_19FT_COMBO_65_30]